MSEWIRVGITGRYTGKIAVFLFYDVIVIICLGGAPTRHPNCCDDGLEPTRLATLCGLLSNTVATHTAACVSRPAPHMGERAVHGIQGHTCIHGENVACLTSKAVPRTAGKTLFRCCSGGWLCNVEHEPAIGKFEI